MKTKLTLVGGKLGFAIVAAFFMGLILPSSGATTFVTKLAPNWTANGGGGVFSAYVGPDAYGYVSPGAIAVFDGREAGIIKAGLAIDPVDGIYEDEGILGFIPNVTIETLAAGPLTYDVVNQYGENPVWMTIEIDTGVVGVRGDNTTYQFVPTNNPAGWHTVDAAAGLWQKWNNNNGDVTGNPLISLNDIAAAHPGCNVVRAYLRLGMGDSYHGSAGQGTVAWIDKATLAGVTYDFVIVHVSNLQPDWTATGGGGVYSAYYGPPLYADGGPESPGSTAIYDGREAGIIKAGINEDPIDNQYYDEGLFGFKPNDTIDELAASLLTFDVANQTGANPAWMTIEVDTGEVDNRDDNTTYQFVPTNNPAGWHTVDAAAGLWQKWNNNEGDVSENPLISLSDIAAAHPGCNVVRAYLRLGIGNSYHGTGSGTIAWVDKATINGVTYDFVLSDQTITFGSLADQVTTNTVLLSATATSGLPVSFSVLSGPAALSDGTNLTFTGSGSVSIVATQSGNINWHAATAVTNTFTVSLTAQTISFAGIADQLTTNTVTLGATASNGLPVSFELVSGAKASLAGNVLRFTGEGTVSVRAIQAGDAMWSAAEPVTNTFAVTKTPTSITLGDLSQIYNGSGLVITGTPGQPGLTLLITYDGSTNAPVNAGDHTVVVTIQDGMYQGSVTGTLTIAKADQTISFGALADQVTTNTLTLGATASSGLPVSFSVVSGPGVLNGADLTFTSAGSVSIVAAQGGNGNWNAASAVTNTCAVSLTAQTITFAPIADQVTTNALTLGATASSTLPVSFELVSGANATLAGNALTFTGEGTVSVRAIQAGDAMWSAAEPVTNTFAVTKTPTSITLDGLNQTYNGSGLVINGTPGQSGLTLQITYDGNATAPVNAGTYTVIVTIQDGMYQGSVTGTLTIAKASQVISFPVIPDQLATNEVLLSATATSGLTVSFAVVSGPAEWDGTTLTFTNYGPVSIEATQTGNGNWLAATPVTRTFNVTKTPQTITFPTPGDKSITNSVVLSATASSELPVSFSVVDGPGLISDGTNLTFNGVGPVSIMATQAGDDQWAVATPVINTINVAPYPAWQKPDFVVDSITILPSSPALGGTFTARVTVHNGGFVRGNAGLVKVWAHHPATAISNEVADASQTAGTLDIGATNVLTITGLTAPSVPGTCTLRAFVDGNDRTPEASEGNNQTTLTYYPAMPDFVVTAITLAPTTLTNGNTFTATVTVKNQGPVTGNAGLLRIWLSHGATAVTNEPGDAAQTVGSLAAGESKDLVFSGLIATNKAGSYYLRAFVDANNAAFESNDANNQNTLAYTVVSTGGGGGTPTGNPDFTVTAITLAPTALTNGNTFAATVTVMNTGAVAGDAGLLRIWLSHGATAVTNETGDGEQAVGTLAVGASTSLTFTNLTAPALAGTHYLRAFVDANNSTVEQSEFNNQTTLAYTVASAGSGGGGTGKPDFTITAISIAPTALTNGNTFAATVTVMNTGAGAGDAGLLRIWLSHGAAAVTNETGDGEQAVGTLAVGASTSLTFTNLTAPALAGTHYLRAFVDANNATLEQSEFNNQNTLAYTVASAGSGGGGTGKPDFTVTALSIAPTALTNGNRFAATVTVKNQGAVSGNAGVLKLWLSHGATATTNEPGDATLAVGTLAAGASTSLVFTNLTAPALAGTHYLRAFVDGNNATAEQSEGNNQSTLTYTVVAAGGGSGGGGVTGKPDFLVTAISFSPTNLTLGCTFTAYITIVNNGPAAGNAGSLDIYLNRGATATVGLAGNANQTIGTLAAGETRIITFTGLTAPATKGTYYFRAFVDSQGATDEQSEGNNQKTKTYGFY